MDAPLAATEAQNAKAAELLTGPDWYRHAVFYEVNVRSFQDSNGDGIGDLPGLTSRLDYLKGLGIDALWLMPIMKSPFVDSGYDVADYEALMPEYGTMADYDELLAQAHARGMRVLVDLVLNHTSDKHAWFQESRANKTGPKADYYVWSDTPSAPGNACGTSSPTFGDTAWEKDSSRGQYYFHRFYAGQPDLNFDNPAVVDETLAMVRRWLARGTDGFRCDVIGLLFESAKGAGCLSLQPKTVEYIKKLRAVLDEFPDRAMVAEAFATEPRHGYYGSGNDMFHMVFDFSFGYLWRVYANTGGRGGLDRSFHEATNLPRGAQDALVIGSHDVERAAASGPWRSLRVADIELLARGTPFVYYGDELGLLPGPGIVVDERDSARTPMPWTREAPGHGFSPHAPWIEFAPEASTTNVEAEDADRTSPLAHYRQLLALRRGHAVFGTGDMDLVDIGTDRVFAFVRRNEEEAWLVAVNLGEEPQSCAAEVEGARADLALGVGHARREGNRLLVDVAARESLVVRLR